MKDATQKAYNDLIEAVQADQTVQSVCIGIEHGGEDQQLATFCAGFPKGVIYASSIIRRYAEDQSIEGREKINE